MSWLHSLHWDQTQHGQSTPHPAHVQLAGALDTRARNRTCLFLLFQRKQTNRLCSVTAQQKLQWRWGHLCHWWLSHFSSTSRSHHISAGQDGAPWQPPPGTASSSASARLVVMDWRFSSQCHVKGTLKWTMKWKLYSMCLTSTTGNGCACTGCCKDKD